MRQATIFWPCNMGVWDAETGLITSEKFKVTKKCHATTATTSMGTPYLRLRHPATRLRVMIDVHRRLFVN